MSTAQLTAVRARLSADSFQARSAAPVAVPMAIGLVLLAVILYAAFDHGAVSQSTDTRIELVITGVAVTALVPWLWTRTLRLAAPRTAAVGAGLLGAFALWSGITVLWSVAPDQTWIEVNRVITYLLVLALAMAIGSTYARALELILVGFVVVAAAVTVYALGQKLFPGFHIRGLFDLNQAGPLPRLQEPLGYWNALALFLAMAVPPALALAADAARSRTRRVAALCAIELMLLTIVFTYSRGGLLALAVALVMAIALSANRLRSTLWLGVAVLAGLPVAIVGLVLPQLTTSGEKLASRESAGAALAALLALSLIGLVLGARKLVVLEPRIRLDASRVPGLKRLAAGGAGIVVLGVVLALAFSPRGLTGTVSHAWHTFTTTQPASNYDANRLLSADSQNRWVWWKEATGAFSDRPIGGWGAGSFGVVHLLYRHDNLTVQQPHSVPLQFLSETGIVGAILGVGAFVLLLRSATAAVRRRPSGSERLLAAAALGGAVAYTIHSLYDWDWEIPAVTLPALAFLGVVMSTRARVSGPAASSSGARTPMVALLDPRTRPRLGGRTVGLVMATLWLGVFALSVELPQLAAAKASAALVDASSTSPVALAQAQWTARTASDLDPLSDAGLEAQATLALHTGQLANARLYLHQAVQRQPTDAQAWNQLAYVDVLLRDYPGVLQAGLRVIALDPHGQNAVSFISRRFVLAPPDASPTAKPTPLPLP